MSLLVIGAVGAFMFGAGTFAPFTDSASDSGTITAGTVSITVEGTGASLDFELVATATDCDLVAPGDVCDDIVTVANTGNFEVTLSPSPAGAVESGDLETCGDGDQLSTVVGAYTDVATDGVTTLAAGDSETFTVTTTFSASSTQVLTDTCQGDQGTVTVTVDATS